MATSSLTNLEEALSLYKNTAKQFLSRNTINNYSTYISTTQKELDSSSIRIRILEDWILCDSTIKSDDSINEIMDKFDSIFRGYLKIGKYDVSSCRAALSSFSRFILGYYKGHLYFGLSKMNDLQSCQLVAQNALFCTIEVANDVKAGKLGSDINKKIGGNLCYSWFCCEFQRKKGTQPRHKPCTILAGGYDPQGTGTYTIDDNTYAGQAIKKAVLAGLPKYLRVKVSLNPFTDYMACHIWEDTCHDYRYHTSVFNLVLLPTSIAGLSDYNDEVKRLLEYESAYRFGVYPQGKTINKQPKYYDKLHDLWRQQDEHQQALNNIAESKYPIQVPPINNTSISAKNC